MPSTTPERAARWPDYDQEAIQYLRKKGWELTHGFEWRHSEGRIPEVGSREEDAMIYLIEEWDFGGYIT